MKVVARLLFLLMLGNALTAPAFAVDISDAQRDAYNNFPKYPIWLARILAPFGVAGAQAIGGFQALTYDPCKGFNWLLGAAQQHQLFGEWQLMGAYFMVDEITPIPDHREKVFLWHLHWATHFPNDDDLSFTIAKDMLKFTPEQERALREKFKTWTPADERPMEPASCPSSKFGQ